MKSMEIKTKTRLGINRPPYKILNVCTNAENTNYHDSLGSLNQRVRTFGGLIPYIMTCPPENSWKIDRGMFTFKAC